MWKRQGFTRKIARRWRESRKVAAAGQASASSAAVGEDAAPQNAEEPEDVQLQPDANAAIAAQRGAQLLRRDLTRAVEAGDFGIASTLAGELQKLFPKPEDAAFLADEEASTDNESVVIPTETRPTNYAADNISAPEYTKCLSELDQRRAREEELLREVSHLRTQLQSHQADMLPQVGSSAIIINPSRDKEPYLGWLCTIVGQRQDNPSWMLRLMWKHPLGDLVQMPAESFLVHPALGRMQSRLGELPCRYPRQTEEIDALLEKVKRAAVPGPTESSQGAAAAAGASVEPAAAAHRSLTRRSSDSPILAPRQRTSNSPTLQSHGRSSEGQAPSAGRSGIPWLEQAKRVREDGAGGKGMAGARASRDIEGPESKRRREQASPVSAPSFGSSSTPASVEGQRPVPRGDRERGGWTQEEEERLIAGQQRYGNHWESIRKKCNLTHRKGTQCREKWRNLDRQSQHVAA